MLSPGDDWAKAGTGIDAHQNFLGVYAIKVFSLNAGTEYSPNGVKTPGMKKAAVISDAD
jgi:hypothetical protein